MWYDEFSLGYIDFKTAVGHPSGCIQQVVSYKHSYT